MAVANVPTAIYALCNPAEVPFDITALKLDSPKGRAWVVAVSTSEPASFVFTTPSKMNSSKIHTNTHRHTYKYKHCRRSFSEISSILI